MNDLKLICTTFLILLIMCQCNNKINTKGSERKEMPNNIISEKSDTLSFCGYDMISQDFTDTSTHYRVAHSPENNLFIYENLKYNNRREVVYDSTGLRQVTQWRKGVVQEKVFLQFFKDGKVQKIERYKIGYDSLHLFSIEEYSYSEGLLNEVYFKDFEWVGNRVGSHKFLRETITNYNYDNLNRIKTSIVKLKKNDKYATRDTVKYFYKGDAVLPYEVHRKLESGAKYYITQQQKNTIKIEKISSYEDGYYIQTDALAFDDKKRVVEYLSNERLDPQQFPHVYWKYEITYPADSNLTQVPNLVFQFKSLYPKSNIGFFLESIVNPGAFRNAQVRTDIGYNYIPKTVLVHRSDDGENWKLKSKLILHE